MSPLLGIVDYGRGNLRSVGKALETVGAGVRILSSPAEIDGCSALVLPGVGAFGDCARSLEQRGFTTPLMEWLQADKPFLGICLGYQVLFESSAESPGSKGLGFFQGTVRRFVSHPGRKIPHMGWNSLSIPGANPLFEGLPARPHVYFVHSFHPEPADPSVVSAWCEYGAPFAASVSLGNIHAVQFHPEKSQDLGLRMLQNFTLLAKNHTA
jgi:imidazole glycerol-phosphate synthase subunit HisH